MVGITTVTVSHDMICGDSGTVVGGYSGHMTGHTGTLLGGYSDHMISGHLTGHTGTLLGGYSDHMISGHMTGHTGTLLGGYSDHMISGHLTGHTGILLSGYSIIRRNIRSYDSSHRNSLRVSRSYSPFICIFPMVVYFVLVLHKQVRK